MGKSRNRNYRQNVETNPENPEAMEDEEEEMEVFEGEIDMPEEAEARKDEEEKKVKVKKVKKGKKPGFFKRAFKKAGDALDSVTVLDVVKGIGIFGLGVGAGVLGMIALGNKDDQPDHDALPGGDCPEDRKFSFVDDEETPFDD